MDSFKRHTGIQSTSLLLWSAILTVGVILTLSIALRNVRAVTPADHGENKPSSFVLWLPWRQTGNTTIRYGYGPYWGAGTHGGTDYYSLDFELPEGTPVYPAADGVVLYAGQATGGFCGYGNFVFVDHENGYKSFYAHLRSVTVIAGTRVNLTRQIGEVGHTSCYSYPTHLHFTLNRDSRLCTPTSGCSGFGPEGGVPIVPEPLIGRDAYEGFGLRWSGHNTGWQGPVEALAPQIDTVPGQPRGDWRNGATPNGTQVELSQPVRFSIEGLPSDTKEVRLTAGYRNWSIMEDVLDDQVWRILARCWPDRQSTGCQWSGDRTTLVYDWVPHNDNLFSAAPWLPSGTGQVFPAYNSSYDVPVCISFDVFDRAGNVTYAPAGTNCSSLQSRAANRTQLSAQESSSISTSNDARLIYVRPINTTVPTPTFQPPPPPSGWNQTFFADNNLGSQCGPIRNESDVYMFRDSDAGWTAPAGCPGVENAWSVRMERSDAWFDGGIYEFGLFYDDAARLYVDGQLVVDGWNATQHYESRYLSPGNHHLRLEYKNNAGHAIVQLWWRGPGALPFNTQTRDGNQWWVNYWGNQTQWQDAVGSRNEGTGFLDRQWDYGGPGFGIPGDHFSTRYERSIYFNCGTYRLHLASDDGSRLWIDGSLVPEFDRWTTGVWGTITSINFSAGYHTLKVDHFENGGAAHLQFDWYQVSSCPNPPALISPSQFAEFDEEDGITLSWSGNGSQYYVEYEDTDGVYTANSGWQTGTSWTIGTLPAGKVYTWRVKARNSSGESYWSAPRIFTVQPAAPSDLIVPMLTCTEVTLSWEDNSSVEEGFNIYRDGVRIASVGANISSFADSSASRNVTHSYYVATFIDNVESRASNTVSVYAPSCEGIPGDANGDGEVDGVDYVIWLNHYDTNTTLGPTEGDFNLDGIVDGVDYVIWLNNYGISVGNTTSTVNAPASVASVPQAPGNLALSYEANGSNTATIVRLSWSDNADNEDGFSLIWNTDGYGDLAVTTLANPPSTNLRPDTTSSVLTVIPCGSNSREWSFSASLSAFNTEGASNQVSIQEYIAVPACPAVIATPTPTVTPQPSPAPSPTSMFFPDPTSTPVPQPTFTPTPIGYHVVHRYYLPLTVGE